MPRFQGKRKDLELSLELSSFLNTLLLSNSKDVQTTHGSIAMLGHLLH